MTSGSSEGSRAERAAAFRRESEERLLAVLDRQVPFESLSSLIHALHPSPSTQPLQSTAIGLDANVFLRMSSHSKSADIIDYLSSAHAAPLILPGQAVQEFWNNQLQAVDSVAAGLRKRFEQLKTDVSRVDPAFGEFAGEFEALLEKFSGEYGYAYDEATVRRTQALLEAIQAKARVPYASRAKFADIAAQRKRTKTPPGFKDDGDGDFYIWIDLLLGLCEARAAGEAFDRVVLVSQDRKADWMRESVAHPLLASEVNSLLSVPFEIWSLQKLADEIGAVA